MAGELSPVKCAAASCCGVAIVVAAVGIVTMLVVGILGVTHVIPMSPLGARVMIGISSAVISVILTSALSASCRM